MDAEFAKLWVADLRDPANKQCKSQLYDGVGYCCLGRAAVLAGARLVPQKHDHWSDETEGVKTDDRFFVIDGTQITSEIDSTERVEGECESLTRDIAKKIGMRSEYAGINHLPAYDGIKIGDGTYRSLADANDGGATFAQIADWIEANYELL